MNFHEISTFDKKFDELDSDKRHHYEDQAQSLIEDYEAKIGYIVKKAGISTKKLYYLIKNQYQVQNYNYYDALR